MHMNTSTSTTMLTSTIMSGPIPSTAGSRVADHPVTAASGRIHPARPAATTGPASATHRRSLAHPSLAAGLRLAPKTTPAPETEP